MAAVPEKGRLLVARHGAHGHAGEAGAGHLAGHGPVPAGRRAHLAEGAEGHAEDLAQLGRPGPPPDVVTQGAAGVGGVGDVDARGGAPRQVPADPVVDGPEGEGGARLHAAVLDHPGPFRSGEIRVENEPGALAHEGQVAGFGELGAAARGPPILPDDRPMGRPPRRPVPGDGRLALVGDPDRGRFEPAFVQLGAKLAEGGLDEVPDLGGVVLDQAGSGEVLGQLPIRGRHHVAALVEGQGAHAGGTCVYRHHHGHASAP